MNKARRKELEALKDQLEGIKAAIEQLSEQEADYFDAMPESLQAGERGTKAEAAIDAMAEAVDAIENAMDSLETAAE